MGIDLNAKGMHNWHTKQCPHGGALLIRPGCVQTSLQIMPIEHARMMALLPELLRALGPVHYSSDPKDTSTFSALLHQAVDVLRHEGFEDEADALQHRVASIRCLLSNLERE